MSNFEVCVLPMADSFTIIQQKHNCFEIKELTALSKETKPGTEVEFDWSALNAQISSFQAFQTVKADESEICNVIDFTAN